MSDDEQTPGTAGGKDEGRAGGTPAGPLPEEIRHFGTSWVDHENHYTARRLGLAAASFVAVVAAGFVLRFGYEGLQIANVGGFVNVLVVLMFAVCTAIAFVRTWDGFQRRPADPAREESLRSLKAIGFIGSLLAYGIRCLVEAPGEKLLRAEYETARTQYEKRRSHRTGNPATRKKPKRK
ncbi:MULTISPECIES: hypothetical protein [unclassified Streptomyces]|uniref:hypothetical protein n=1 Tax=unclassified Streptomyces TaxID=2593676 RepID=UPI0016616F98|nr:MULTISPECIES: hypothetical protein [unclassified Streptomyces]MBD0707587.1 hypothetical protein [Streptomyces sp. CBMA291]MBD0716366.1 hypothetical protein [Streptomyces sp. CBMA370]